MRTDDLIAELAARPWPATRPTVRMIFAIFAGWAAALAGMALFLGPPLAAVANTGVTPFALKLGYTLALTALAARAALAAGRPGQRLWPSAAMIGAPVGLILMAASLELSQAAPSQRHDMMFGTTFQSCVLAISLASVPLFASLVWAFRVLAPTRPALAGFLAGLSAGAAGAVAYALYCPETTASFLMASYTPGILLPAAAGALLGRTFLRW